MLSALSHFALNVGFVFRLESIKMGCLLSFANGDIYLLDSIIHTTGPQPHTYIVKSDKPSSLNIALHPAKKTSYEEKSRNNLGLESSSCYINKIMSLLMNVS